MLCVILVLTQMLAVVALSFVDIASFGVVPSVLVSHPILGCKPIQQSPVVLGAQLELLENLGFNNVC